MSSVLHTTKLLIVDTDTAMAQVLKTFAKLKNYESDVFTDSADACAALAERAANPDLASGYDCMILGWPKGEIRIISDLLIALSNHDCSDLPLIILSEEPDQELQNLARRRPQTQTMLWHEYKRIESVLADIAPVNREVSAVLAGKQNTSVTQAPGVVTNRLPTSVLLVDDSPAVCHVLRDMLESNGYYVALANTVAEARSALAKNNFDLILTEFFLPEESGEGLCLYLQSLSSNRRPVYAVMARKNLESTVQRSLSVGAIACLDKSESTEILYARLNAIAKGLSSRTTSSAPPAHSQEKIIGVADMLQTVKVPSLLIDEHRKILAANDAAADFLSAGDLLELHGKDFEKSIHGAPVRRSVDAPVKALFKTLEGKSLSVAYRSRDIDVSEYGIEENVCMLTFESVEQILIAKKPALTNEKSVYDFPVTVNRTVKAVRNSFQSEEIEHGVVAGGIQLNGAVEKPLDGSDSETTNGLITNALNNEDANFIYSLLAMDIKMVAAVTGDRLSLGHSEPMLEIVKIALAKRCAQQDALKYIGGGRFVVLYKTDESAKPLDKAEKLVSQIPELDTLLRDVQLMSHASYVELPRQSELTADYILKHSTIACLRAEKDGLDNKIFQIGGVEMPTGSINAERLKTSGTPNIDVSDGVRNPLESRQEMQAS